MRKIVLVVIALGGMASLAAAAQKADLNGAWKLNVAKSFMGGDHPFSDYQLTKKIVQKGEVVSITDTAVHNSVVNIPLPDSTNTMEVTTDGKEHEVELPPPFPGRPAQKVMVTGSWEGCTLALREISSGLANYGEHRLFLSQDGSQLIDVVESHSTYGDSEQRLVFDRVR